MKFFQELKLFFASCVVTILFISFPALFEEDEYY